jgi:fucose 4-O-acetylase-like acetyltransferase
MSGYGSAPAPKGDDNGKPVDPNWVTSLREFTGAGTTSSERLDVAKFVFIMLVSSGHFLEPFYKIGNRGVGAYMHAIYGFHVPAFVLISGYVSGDLNPKRRRALIAGTIAPYVIMHVIFSLFYTRAFCEGEWTDERGHAECEFVNKWALMDPVVGRWDGWDKWTFAYPFAQMWYLVSLFTKRLWRPFALEMRWTLAFHVCLGVLVGYTTIGRFLSIHRSTVHMPYFLCGFLMRKHRCFFPSAKTPLTKAMAVAALIFNVGCALMASFTYGMRVEVWFQSDPHDEVYGSDWAYGALYQLCLYAWTFFTMMTVFALIPEPEQVGVKYESIEETLPLKGADVEGAPASASKPQSAASSRGKYGKERDQDSVVAKVYLRCAKWGARTLYPFVMHIAALLLVARYTGWYDITWTTDGADPSVSIHAVWTLLMAYTFTIVLSLKPVVGLFKFLLEPNITPLFSPELQKL